MRILRTVMPHKFQLLAVLAFGLAVLVIENQIRKIDESREILDKKRWLKLIRRDKFTPNYNSRVCGWHFPDGKAAGPTRFAWNDGKAFPDHISTKRKKGMVPASVEDEGTAGPGPNHLDVATQTPGTSNVVVLEIENDMLRKENDQLKQELEKQKQTLFIQSNLLPP
ncbi:Heparan sulfate 2-O-sulfotransferase 1 [Merluccius polli]|uniref:Heparan sulfate 2-O-sulfotransferase 1 n=1 Tax=Merluccius polli TaxID=89951 RepID=A0AA47MEK0_MERPO|nr:Heparan sulfate 2-O-sulfotransferase 1 [Merluccius polli]